MVWRMGPILGLLPSPSPPSPHQGRQLARIKTQHRSRQGVHKQGVHKRRHSLWKQDRQDCKRDISIPRPVCRQHLCDQSAFKDGCIKGYRKLSFEGQRLKGHCRIKASCGLKTVNRLTAELPQAGIYRKRKHRNSRSKDTGSNLVIQIAGLTVIQEQRNHIQEQFKLYKPVKLQPVKFRQEQLQQRQQL